MIDVSQAENQILSVANFRDFVETPFSGKINAICWTRKLQGDFLEIVNKIATSKNITVVSQEELCGLELSEEGQLAREIILNDLDLLTAHGAAPTLNVIKNYDRDDDTPFFPTDVYSFHIDRSPIPLDTILCTYSGDSSEILPNSQCQKKIDIPEIREAIKKAFLGDEKDFETFLAEHFLDLHYQPKPNAVPISTGVGHLWRLAIDHPESQVLPCIHRAPVETFGQKRLLLIC